MTEKLIINGNRNVLRDFGVIMGDGFLEALSEPLNMKEYVENESRLEHGKRIIISDTPRIASRDVSLVFAVFGNDRADFLKKKSMFMEEMYKGEVRIVVPEFDNLVYSLVYTGKGSEFSLSADLCSCKIVLKFTEPNPANRPVYLT